jgi:serine/threonine-protein phosphatase 2A regulatory subunit A
MSSALNQETLKDTVLPSLITLSKDAVPNIRFNVAKAMEVIVPTLKKTKQAGLVGEIIKPALTKMAEDTDPDVRYYAGKALSVC